MNNKSGLLETLRKRVQADARNQSFRHHRWFVPYHLEIAERLAHELCDIYPDADRNHVLALVWAHDYEKIIDFDNQYNEELRATQELLASCGYDRPAIGRMCDDIRTLNRKENIAQDSLEVQIVSSADGASHLIGPFQAIYWQENSQNTIAELQAETLRKITVDWDKKITLPEVRNATLARYEALHEWVEVPKHIIGPSTDIPNTPDNA